MKNLEMILEQYEFELKCIAPITCASTKARLEELLKSQKAGKLNTLEGRLMKDIKETDKVIERFETSDISNIEYLLLTDAYRYRDSFEESLKKVQEEIYKCD